MRLLWVPIVSVTKSASARFSVFLFVFQVRLRITRDDAGEMSTTSLVVTKGTVSRMASHEIAAELRNCCSSLL